VLHCGMQDGIAAAVKSCGFGSVSKPVGGAPASLTVARASDDTAVVEVYQHGSIAPEARFAAPCGPLPLSPSIAEAVARVGYAETLTLRRVLMDMVEDHALNRDVCVIGGKVCDCVVCMSTMSVARSPLFCNRWVQPCRVSRTRSRTGEGKERGGVQLRVTAGLQDGAVRAVQRDERPRSLAAACNRQVRRATAFLCPFSSRSNPVSCRLVSSRVVSCRLVSSRVVSCRLVSCRLVSSRLVSSRVVSCRVASYHV
jgi:hypothetical protein